MRRSPLTLHLAGAIDVGKFFLQNTNARLNETAVGFELRLTRAAHADATAHLFQMRPHARQARQQVLQLRDFDLHARLARPRTGCEDVEDKLRAVHDACADHGLYILPLRWRQFVVKNDERGAEFLHALLELVDFALAEVRRGMRSIQCLRERADDNRSRSISETGKLFQMLIRMMPCATRLERCADKNGALCGWRE